MAADEGKERMLITDVLGPVRIHPLPERWTPVEAIVLIKSLDEEGHSSWCYRTTHPPNREELLGALIAHTDLLRKELLDEWGDDEE